MCQRSVVHSMILLMIIIYKCRQNVKIKFFSHKPNCKKNEQNKCLHNSTLTDIRLFTHHGLLFIKFLSTKSLGTRDPLAFTDNRVNFFLQLEMDKKFKAEVSTLKSKLIVWSHYMKIFSYY